MSSGWGKGIKQDLLNRKPWYVSDWKEGFASGYRIFAPSVFIFFASVIPALAFGEQIENDTDGAFNGHHVLVSAAIAGVAQSFIGGQPLLIMGVAEPIVLMYGFMFEFAKNEDFVDVFVPWCTWVTIWSSLFLFLFAVTGVCKYITKFTRFSGELFGMLIAILFMQQAIKGVVQEFRFSRCEDVEQGQQCIDFTDAEKLVNGLWATILALGTVMSSLLIQSARSWRFFRGGVRSFLADYGVPLMVVVWTGVSYALTAPTPNGIPRRIILPSAWDAAAQENYNVVERLGDVSGTQIGLAVIPAAIIAMLFYFDHNVSAQLAQQKDFQLVRPSAYHWDMWLLGMLMVGAGLMGTPPSNCVIPQAPMHTKSLGTLKKMLVERDEKRKSRLDLTVLDSQKSAVSGKHSEDSLEKEFIELKDGVVPLNIKEQRLSNLIQALLIGGSIAAAPAIRFIPKSVLWGYFAYMALESLPGSEFWDRALLFFTDHHKRVEMLKKEHPVYLETVPIRKITLFTLLQVFLLLATWAVTFAGAIGILFPFLIILLIPARQYVMPKLFDSWTLSQLDAADYEEAPPAPAWVINETEAREGIHKTEGDKERDLLDAEIVGTASIKHHISAEEIQRRRSAVLSDDDRHNSLPPKDPRQRRSGAQDVRGAFADAQDDAAFATAHSGDSNV